MTRKRFLMVMIFLFAMLELLMIRLFFLMSDPNSLDASILQSSYRLEVATERADFYDCNGQKLTGVSTGYKALINPNDLSYQSITDLAAKEVSTNVLERIKEGESKPFLVDIEKDFPKNSLIDTVEYSERYSNSSLASHLLGYVNYDNVGVAGLEYLFDDFLQQNTNEKSITVQVNALNHAVDMGEISEQNSKQHPENITLTIDKRIQTIAETAANNGMERGSVVVLEVETGEIKAMVSRPNFDPNDIATAIEQNNTALINRAVTPYAVGSIYKPVIAAAALSSGYSSDTSIECVGSVEIDGVTYSCNNNQAHGEVDMQKAMEVSCNVYFIELGFKTGQNAVYNTASSLGLGSIINLYDNYGFVSGNLPTTKQLENQSEFANHCFGQGKLLASPLAVAAYTLCFANDGIYKDVSVIKQVGDKVLGENEGRRVVSSETATEIKQAMIQVVESGTGTLGKPDGFSAAGKTGTAETGAINQDGSAGVVGWYTGFFPAENPKYVVTVMVENEGYGYSSAGPVFKEIANNLDLIGLIDS